MKPHDAQPHSAPRQPIVSIMGHIDHGKTTLLDYIQKTTVADREAGGITQHVTAYEAEHKSADGIVHKITFIDTPGHEAFAGVRSRGAHVADIAILIVSGEDGVKPQTREALKFITASKTPYIVAITKIDKPASNVDRTKQSLLEHEIYVEGYGGEVPCIPVSGKTGEGISELLDMILLVAEVNAVSATMSKSAEGFVLEATRSKEKGITATLIIRDGSLEKGAVVVSGTALSPVRSIQNFAGKNIDRAIAGQPIKISGWDSLPEAGTPFVVFATKKEAENYLEVERAKAHSKKSLSQRIQPEDTRTMLPLVIKADVSGSLEAIQYELQKLATDKIYPRIMQGGTGDINESDAKIAHGAAGCLILGFHVKIDSAARNLIERDNIPVEQFDIIYKLIERVQALLIERTPKVATVETRGTAKIIRIFSAVKDKQIVGGKVHDGTINLGDEIKIMRRGAEVGTGKIRELQQQKTKTSEVLKDREFGAMLQSSLEIAPGDMIEAFTVVTK